MGANRTIKLIPQAGFDDLEEIFKELKIKVTHPKPLSGENPIGRWSAICDWEMHQEDDCVILEAHYGYWGEKHSKESEKIVENVISKFKENGIVLDTGSWGY